MWSFFSPLLGGKGVMGFSFLFLPICFHKAIKYKNDEFIL